MYHPWLDAVCYNKTLVDIRACDQLAICKISNHVVPIVLRWVVSHDITHVTIIIDVVVLDNCVDRHIFLLIVRHCALINMITSINVSPCPALSHTQKLQHALPSPAMCRNRTQPVCISRELRWNSARKVLHCRISPTQSRTIVRCSAESAFSPGTTHVGLLGAGIMGTPMVTPP